MSYGLNLEAEGTLDLLSLGASLSDPNLADWRTVAFATLTISELLRAFTARSERISIFKLGVFSNKTMNAAVLF